MRRRRPSDAPEIQIAPMIDCVFLMLVYFMTTSSLEKSEADLPCPVGAAGIVSDPLPAIDEQTLAINGKALINWNGSIFDLDDLQDTREFLQRLVTFRDTCAMAGSEPSLRILPDATVCHQAIVTLLDSVSRAEIEKIHFP